MKRRVVAKNDKENETDRGKRNEGLSYNQT